MTKKLNCLVTGASSGIGKEIATYLSNYVRHIYICSRNVKNLEKVSDQIVKNKCECTIVPLNLSDDNGIENLAKQIFNKDGSLDILILSAGMINQLSPVDAIELEKLKEVLNLNYISNFRMIKNFHPLLKNSDDSNIAVISSLNDESKGYYWGIYQPIMTALNDLIITYANENKKTNIKTNIFCPKAVNTELRTIIMPGEDKNKISKPYDVAVKIVDYLLNNTNSGNIIEIN